MKKIFWSFFYTSKKILLWIIYLIFTVYIIYLVSNTDGLGAKIIFGLIGSIVLTVVLLFEYLKRKYEQMIYALTIDCDIPRAENLKMVLEIKDIFNGFKRSMYIFDALLLLDKGEYRNCLEHLAKHERFFRSTYDYLFIYYHTQLHCYYFLEDYENAEHILNSIVKLKSLKKKQLSGLYSWHEIEGIKFYLQGRNKKSLEAFSQVDTSRLNNRELAYLFYMQGCSLIKSGDTSEGNHFINKSRSVGKTLCINIV
ncbi:hypothetical protein IW492_03040 [Enterococcus sp. BWB1-3]|uniref:hypothetical protein n=1 Tax=unclassified Enterococcus TaxID=2608891 RepID=UPI001922B19B|nr:MULTISPECIES: hypothetical protein [unclassified Enterococcus]MBL1228208.1 hypothetical protein [Enterococcus sp. BWB1-3]MCB5951945.1 hypothetical protein [Enterococcus sp. BWT-B8]